MQQRQLGPFTVSAIGLGCMNLSHAYGTPPSPAQAEALLLAALDAGVDHFDTAALYGFGANEALLGRVLKPHRHRFTLASKCGMQGVDGQRVIDGRPATLKATCDEALRRLATDCIDLYYLHRWDKSVPIEDSVGALAELVQAGKIRSIGLSEVSAATLRRAVAVHPVAAVQSEYSLWTRNPERGILQACRELGVTLVAFSPLGRGFLAGSLPDAASLAGLPANDIRRAMPRFTGGNHAANLPLLGACRQLAAQAGCTLAQLALAWVLSRGDHVLALPGTTSLPHLQENLAASSVSLPPEVLLALEGLLQQWPIAGERYNAANQREIDTE